MVVSATFFWHKYQMTQNIIKLDEYWPYQVTVLADIITRHTTSVLKTHGDLNISQWRVLAAVAESPGRTAAKVVAVTPMDKGIVSRATASLVESHIIEKIHDKIDRRSSRLYLTKTGEKIYAQISADLTSRTNGIISSDSFNLAVTAAIQSMLKLNPS